MSHERNAFKGRHKKATKEVLYGKLNATSAKEEPQGETVRKTEQIFTDDQIASLTGFFDTLKRIHTRLAIEGYVITPEGIQAPTTRSSDAKDTLSPASIN